MLLLGVLVALLAAGLWMYAIIDILLTPGPDCRGLSKGSWLAIAGLLFIPGSLAWLVFGRPYATPGRYLPGRAPRSPWYSGQAIDLGGMDAEAALRRHPAGRARHEESGEVPLPGLGGPQDRPATAWPIGPDDDPDFLRYLDCVIRDLREDEDPS
jgi:hypothetical protein